jgi:SAM-dependent methyltransferase
MLFQIKEALDRIAKPLYNLQGRRPWSLGYYTAKKDTICAGIDHGLLKSDEQLPSGYGSRIDERSIEYPWIFAQLPAKPGNVLDAGSALNHRFLIERAPLKDAQLTIMTLAPEKRCFWGRSISYVFGDLRNTMFSDASFDVIVSVSTIEHIGLDNTMLYTSDATKNENDANGYLSAIKEFKRILKPGGICLITVPYGKHEVQGWYQVFNERMITELIAAFQPVEHSVDYFGYGMDGWSRTVSENVANADFFDFHKGRGYAHDYAAAARAVACIRLIA